MMDLALQSFLEGIVKRQFLNRPTLANASNELDDIPPDVLCDRLEAPVPRKYQWKIKEDLRAALAAECAVHGPDAYLDDVLKHYDLVLEAEQAVLAGEGAVIPLNLLDKALEVLCRSEFLQQYYSTNTEMIWLAQQCLCATRRIVGKLEPDLKRKG